MARRAQRKSSGAGGDTFSRVVVHRHLHVGNALAESRHGGGGDEPIGARGLRYAPRGSMVLMRANSRSCVTRSVLGSISTIFSRMAVPATESSTAAVTPPC